jgi:hypothetical protein
VPSPRTVQWRLPTCHMIYQPLPTPSSPETSESVFFTKLKKNYQKKE